MINVTICPKWLTNKVIESNDKRYRHRFLKEKQKARAEAIKELKDLVKKAHEDTIRHLRSIAGVSLDPLNDIENDPVGDYPHCLDKQTLKGYFGEIFAGIIAECFNPFDINNWEVPAFLFRFHFVELQHLEIINQTGQQCERRPGRTGDDCLAFQRDEEGRIIRSLVCEAKCTADHDSNMIAVAHEKVSEPNLRPVDILRIIEILLDYDDTRSVEWVSSLRRLYFRDITRDYERCDLVCYLCGRSPTRANKNAWLPTDKPHNKYTGNRRLESVEIHLNDVDNLVLEVYSVRR